MIKKQFKHNIMSKVKDVILEGLERRIDALSAARDAAAVPARGWLRAVREAIGITQSRAAERAAVSRQSYAQFEASEARGAISVSSLRRAARALDCELVHFIVPRAQVAATYGELAAVHDPVARHMRATEHSMSLGGQGGPPRVPEARQGPGP